jgi:drug/metabolite transporter (DMT)-like permease
MSVWLSSMRLLACPLPTSPFLAPPPPPIEAALVMTASCLLAVLVNISQFMCLGRFSAVSFQVCLSGQRSGFCHRLLPTHPPTHRTCCRLAQILAAPFAPGRAYTHHPELQSSVLCFYQVLGHSKTVMVLLGGWAFYGDSITRRKLLGMTLAVAGMVWYGKASTTAPPQPLPSPLRGSGTDYKRLVVSDSESSASAEKGVPHPPPS